MPGHVRLDSSRTSFSAHPSSALSMTVVQEGPCSPGTPHLGQEDVLPYQCPPKPHWEPVPCPSRTREPAPQPHVPQGTGSTPPCSPYLRRRWSGLLQGPPEKRRWAKGAEGGRLFTASSHGRIGDVGRRVGTRDLRLQAGQDSSTLNSARGTAGHGTVPPPLRLLLHPHKDGGADSCSSCCSSTHPISRGCIWP